MKMKRPATLGALREVMQASIRKIGQEFRDADDDWASVFATQNERGVTIGLLEIGDDLSKEVLGETLRRFMRSDGVFRYALLANAHGVVVKDSDAAELYDRWQQAGRLEYLPEAVEQLVLTVGDAEQEEMWIAEIKRNARGLRYHGPWEKVEGRFEGRFAGLNEYLR